MQIEASPPVSFLSARLNESMDPRASTSALQILAILLACAVFPLVFVGAGVTSKDAGMAFPDWPTSNGSLVNPAGWWQMEDTRWEHGHRLIGWVVGMLAIAVAGLSLRGKGAVRWLGPVVLLAIIAQGVLGGLRVWEVSTALAMLHGVFGQVCFCLAAATALIASPAWQRQRQAFSTAGGSALRILASAAAVVVFAQLLSGAAYRHFVNDAALFIHLGFALVVLLILGWLAIWLLGAFELRTLPGSLGRALLVLLLIQVVLGVATFIVVVAGSGADTALFWLLPSVHTAVGALLLVCSVLAALSVRRTVVAEQRASAVTGGVVPA